ncbi:hypothetical protein CVT24_006975 [Panaeolus cyanescens]|uniref:Uncharacterized protein n=1 Tax=Panaeolus cyanescens TaxID=181874 RepID=A0A409YX31_9AGAR|nr:hypothetical protein CVT24_006975 [Panaeolus cyanescens]
MITLNEDGSNWPVYRAQLQSQLEVRGLNRHLRGTGIVPTEIIRHGGRYYYPSDIGFRQPLMPGQVNYHENRLKTYRANEAKGKNLLSATLPTLIYQRIMRLKTLRDQLEELDKMFASNHRSKMSLKEEMEKLRYDGGLIRSHIWRLEEYRDQLLDLGQGLSDWEFATIFAGSLKGYPDLHAIALKAANPALYRGNRKVGLKEAYDALID